MFIEPHPGARGRGRRFGPSALVGFAVLLLIVLGQIVRREPATPDLREQPALDLTPALSEAASLIEKGDVYRASQIYAQAFSTAAWFDDWEALLKVASGLQGLGDRRGPGLKVETVLIRALVAAESRRSAEGVKAVAHALDAIGEREIAASALARLGREGPADQPSK